MTRTGMIVVAACLACATCGSLNGQVELAEVGGSFADGNLATAEGAAAFASDVLGGGSFEVHQIPHLNDGIYGNTNSWIGEAVTPAFVGVALGGSATVASIAWGRDNGGEETEFVDRAAGFYTVEYTTVETPDAATTDWIPIGTVYYRAGCPEPLHLRHRFNFAPVEATGVRIVVPAAGIGGGTAIDEIELYATAGEVVTEETCDIAPPPPPQLESLGAGGPITTPAAIEDVPTAEDGNLARSDAAVAFGSPPHPAPVHEISHLSDGLYGNDNSWLGNEPGPTSGDVYAGVYFTGEPVLLTTIALGRDNTGTFVDRAAEAYSVEVTLDEFDPADDAAVDAATWTLVGVGDDHLEDDAVNLRHVYCLGRVRARAIRVVTALGNVIDEIELYGETELPELTRVEEGGEFGLGNLATFAGAAPFASDVLGGGSFEAHQVAHINDGIYGNANSWIGEAASPAFVGVRFAELSTVSSIAFGRDNGGGESPFSDRALGRYVLQYTDVEAPDETTSDCDWTSIGEVVYGEGFCPERPALRHRFNFDAVEATAVRLVVPAAGIGGGTAIDELEVYSNAGEDLDDCVPPVTLELVETGGPVGSPALPEDVPTVEDRNVARLADAVPFGTPAHPAPVHEIVFLNDGLYGNDNSWLGNEVGATSGMVYAGIYFSEGPVTIDGVALGRDATLQFGDRTAGSHTVEYTTDEFDPADDASVAGASWTSFGDAVDHLGSEQPGDRRRYALDAVEVRAIRVVTTLGNVIDELEVFGDVEPVSGGFLRGDANSDGELDLSDGVFIFRFLFTGGSAPACADAADSNDQGELNISSGIYVLNFLFSGGTAPPAPYPECGADPSDDDLGACDYPQTSCP